MAPSNEFHTIYRSSTDLLPSFLSRYSTEADVRQLETFLDFAPSHPLIHHAVNSGTPAILSFVLPGESQISCIAWDGLIWITGEDIIRVVQARFEAVGRPVHRFKEFRGLIVSYLRRPFEGYHKELDNVWFTYMNMEAELTSLQIFQSEFLHYLREHRCIRTRKRQKVYYWFNDRFDTLFNDILQNDSRLERQGLPPITSVGYVVILGGID